MTSWSDETWKLVIDRLNRGVITPFLGAGACYGALPTGGELAEEMATQAAYTLGDPRNLLEVSQYLSVTVDPLFPKEQVHRRFFGAAPPNFADPTEPHALLAEFPISVYLTTNYDDFMFRALARNRIRAPIRDFYRWTPALESYPSPLDDTFEAHAAHPLVYHLHGMLNLEKEDPDPLLAHSLILTEDDYIRFLSTQHSLPAPVSAAIRQNSCLFIGYRLADWNLRVILQALKTELPTRNFAVLPLWGRDEKERDATRSYFDKYYGSALNIQVYWGTAQEFCQELRARMR
ncbi:MAG: SIR2 family protein [Planctomycetales bacterium]|nr:SIR2 family protein [Planctomycetales bacterium]